MTKLIAFPKGRAGKSLALRLPLPLNCSCTITGMSKDARFAVFTLSYATTDMVIVTISEYMLRNKTPEQALNACLLKILNKAHFRWFIRDSDVKLEADLLPRKDLFVARVQELVQGLDSGALTIEVQEDGPTITLPDHAATYLI